MLCYVLSIYSLLDTHSGEYINSGRLSSSTIPATLLICDPPISLYKGCSLTKDTKEYLTSFGLKNALYAIKAAYAKEDLFGAVIPCPIQELASSKGDSSHRNTTPR
ncbi:hypothetical protein PTKIN_Ptkin02bG0091100 [Pterospermum kingtungense]